MGKQQDEKSFTIDLDNTYNEYSQKKYQACSKHNLVTHSISPRKQNDLCDKCIQNDDNISTKPIPTIIKDLKTKISTSLTHTSILYNELDRLNMFFNSYQNEFNESNKKKIETLFTYLNKIIQFNQNTVVQILNQCKSEQKSQNDLILSGLDKMKFELSSLQEELTMYENIKDDKELVSHLDRFNIINYKLKDYLNYDLKMDLIKLQVDLREDVHTVQATLLNAVQDSYYIDIDFTKIDGELPTIKNIIQKETRWACICGEIVNILLMI